jgi:demethylmenaquinone methyltransferase/2-methoxy-6-polyprenyl-1,4-benzoquinol methylase
VSRDSEERVERALEDQIRYYRERSFEYDETAKGPLTEHGGALLVALRAFEPRGRVVEFACGTGLYTVELVPFADEITAIDASPEMLELARARIPNPKVRFVESDVFSWEPDAAYDVAFFSFWLSHVPPTHFERFWDLVGSSLGPDGRVFFMDEGPHAPWGEEYEDEAVGIVRRRLENGTEHRAIKVLWDAGELEARLHALGWDVECHGTGPFYWGQGS